MTRKRSEVESPDDIPECLKCPICFDIPKNKVFQCRRGHTVCDDCYPHLTKCPKCRIPFDKEPIHSLVTENMLDEIKFECPYKSSGCKEDVDRKSFADHVSRCIYNIDRFGPFVNVCKVLGCENCPFQANKGNTAETIQHFRAFHKVELRYESVQCTSNSYTTWSGTVNKVIFNREKDGYAFIIIVKLGGFANNKYLSLSAFYWRYPTENGIEVPPPYQIKCNIRGKNYMAFSVTPIDIFQTEGEAPEEFYVKVPASMFVDQPSDVLTAVVKLVRSG